MSKKPTWVELLEASIEELKKEYDARFKELEVRLTQNIIGLQVDLATGICMVSPIKDKGIFNFYLEMLKEILNKWKVMAITIFKEGKALDTTVVLAKAYGIDSFEDLIKILTSKFNIELIKESMTLEQVTEQYGVEGAKIFKEL